MPADYKSRTVRPEKKPLPGVLWLFIGLAIGLFVALIVYLDKQPENEVSFAEAVQQELEQLRKQEQTDADAKNKAHADKPQSNKNEPRFNFYTILPELEVLIPDSELKLDKPKTKTPSPTGNTALQSNKRYLLQAGSFKNRADADRLRASLTLIALDASIEPVRINGEQWYRVRVGPFDNTRDLVDSRNRLKQQGINAMAVKLKDD